MLFRRLVFCCASFALFPAAAPAATVVAIAQPAAQAPMDRYFGKLAMSPLGMINEIDLVRDRAARHEIDSKRAALSLAFVEDSVHDWETQFPHDTWLPRTLMAIKRTYRELGDTTGHDNEKRIDTWLLLRYPASTEARAVIALAAADFSVARATR